MSQFKGNLNHFANFLEQYKKCRSVWRWGTPTPHIFPNKSVEHVGIYINSSFDSNVSLCLSRMFEDPGFSSCVTPWNSDRSVMGRVARCSIEERRSDF